MGKDDIKRFIALYFDSSFNGERLPDVDGQQHFEEAGTRFNPTGKVQIHDNRKDKYALEHNIPLLRIPFDKASQAEEILIDFYKNL